MFGGRGGLSYREMSDFFLHELNKHPSEVGSIEGTNRTETFKSWLRKFQVPTQKRLLLQLCHEEYPMWHGQPSKEDRDELAAMLLDTPIVVVSDPAKLDGQFITETWRKALDRRHDDPDGAITAARSLLESVCKRILDELSVD